jgi:hypothetical protein
VSVHDRPLRIESLGEAGQDGLAARQAALPAEARQVHRAVLRAFLAAGQPPDSPTIRVDGRDVDPDADRRRDYGLSCRLYAGPAGVSGAPPDEWVRALLRVQQIDE